MKRLLCSLLACLLALLAYFAGLPWAALRLDHRFGLVWRLPFWIEPAAALLILASVALAVWFFWAHAFRDDGRPNPSTPPEQQVESGLFRRWRNPLMLAGWLCGAGLACLLRSPSLLGMVGTVAVAGTIFVRRVEEPGAAARFGGTWMRTIARTPRWFVVMLVAAATAAALPTVSVDRPAPARAARPAILVQIRCKPGTASLWRASFDQYVKPAIDAAIARGDSITDFEIIESALPSQPFDFILLYTGKSFAEFDQPGSFHHYAELFQREGSPQALNALKELTSYEDQVTVTPIYLADQPAGAAVNRPAILVEIRCKSGTALLWRASFDRNIRPAIDEVIARGDSFTDFEIIEPALPGQSFNFILLYGGKSFAGLDKPSPFPHYVTMFEREGTLRGLSALKEMTRDEDQASVTLVHLNGTR
ncbi:MAG: methyltransferase [Terracidiphilus sp.]|jgi:protein-S-isoprenylcysteine O-methyltransferase Ste14